MGSARKPPEADVILGVFARMPAAPADRAHESCEVIDFAPFLTTRRQRDSASAAPPAEPA